MGNVHSNQYLKMLKNGSSPDLELYIFDQSREKSEALGQKTAFKTVGSIEELLSTVDAVDICTPTGSHMETARQALHLKKPAFIEKPIVLTVAEAKELLELSRKSDTAVVPGQVVRFFPEYRRLHSMIASGAIGTPASARFFRGGTMPAGAGGWFGNHAMSGGVIVDLGIHDIDFALWCFGEVVSVSAMNLGAKSDHGPDHGVAILIHQSGTITHVETSWMDPNGFSTSFSVSGSDGLLSSSSRPTAAIKASLIGKPVQYEHSRLPEDDPYYLELCEFVRLCRTGEPHSVSLVEGLNALTVALACADSARRGCRIQPATFS